MSLPKLLTIFILLLFVTIGIAALFKKGKSRQDTESVADVQIPTIQVETLEIEPLEIKIAHTQKEEAFIEQPKAAPNFVSIDPQNDHAKLPEADRMDEFFNKNGPKFPFVETITYKSRVTWQQGRPAWLSDYANHYATSRHFIARSLNGNSDYFKQDVAEGDRFNVFRLDKKINFYLLIDTSRSKLWFYVFDLDTQEKTLVKTYRVGLGRRDEAKKSGLLTPLGKYSLGEKVAIYKPKVTGLYNGQKIELMTIFGTRWIPFEKELGNCTAPAKGLGIHGIPWKRDEKEGKFIEDVGSIGKYESDGCIRLATKDMEELFAIIITKPTTIELVRDFHEATLLGGGS